jgi:hypothetical protein
VKLSKRELQKIRAALPTGSMTEISSRSGLGISTVKGSLFYPERFNAVVIETALCLIKEQKERVESLKNLIKGI